MIDDLVKRLRNGLSMLAQEEAADRIEELEAKAIANRVAIMRLEAKLTKAVGALEGVDKFVRDLSPFADPSHRPATALAKACEVYAELTGES